MQSVEERNRWYAERDAQDARRVKELEPLGLTKREYHALQFAGVNVLNDLPRISVADLLSVPQCGTGTVKGICLKLEAKGIRLNGPYIHELPPKLTIEQERDQLRAEVEALRLDAERWSKCKAVPVELLERVATHLEWDGSGPMTTIQYAYKCDGLAAELRALLNGGEV